MAMEFDVKSFLDTLGPKAEIAKWCGVARTAPYGWVRNRYLGSTTMARLVAYSKLHKIDLDMNRFFVRGRTRKVRKRRKNGRR